MENTMHDTDVLQEFAPLFAPRTVAVIGASSKGGTIANVFIRRIREMGYEGEIYAIHPSATEVDGCPAYRSLADTAMKA
jgi:acyl-CoA synthetase (NDP forming)